MLKVGGSLKNLCSFLEDLLGWFMVLGDFLVVLPF